MDDEINRLEKLAHWVFGYLVLGATISLFGGYYVIGIEANGLFPLIGISLIGFSGSSVAALTSSLDRYAKGFERDNGKKEPEGATGETFNRRMVRWFFIRPFLGAIVAPVFLWGIAILADESAKYTETTSHVAFTAFMGGLLVE